MSNNALPLPPRDRSRPLIQLKTHQRRHPLVIPVELSGTSCDAAMSDYNSVVHPEDLTYDSVKHESPPLVHRHVPVLKQVSCPQAPAAFLNVYHNNNKAPTTNNTNIALTSFSDCDKASASPLTLQPNSSRTYLYALPLPRSSRPFTAWLIESFFYLPLGATTWLNL